jgi:hypothetical protein
MMTRHSSATMRALTPTILRGAAPIHSTAVLQYNFVFYAHTTQENSPPSIFFKSTLLS